ncbi:MAG TPA: HAMP domain-containing sensor histidine kinase [Streptosporangiaceae bacterium]|nr:HAMP domain-containing sensor histidine kinase [Streptosporangiaceae bacterium]
MAQVGRSASLWQSLAAVPRRTPLRIKLITALLALVAIALTVISVAGIVILRNDLLGPVDNYLTSQFSGAVAAVVQYQQTGQSLERQDLAIDWITANGAHAVFIPTAGYAGGLNGHPFGPPTQIPGPKLSADPSWLAANSGHVLTLPATSGPDRWRAYMVTGSLSNGTSGTVVLAVNVTSQYTTIGQLAAIDLLASLAVIALLAIAGVAVVRRSLRPLIEIEQTAGAIAAGDLSSRVPERDPGTEVGRLGRSLNVMLSQIEAAFHARARSEESARRSEERMRQFVADASHELRTPLTAIRGFAEYYRHLGGVETNGNGAGELAPADLDRIMRRVEQEASRMGILVEDMLLLARLDQQRPLNSQPVDLLSLAADAVHDARVVAPDRTINLTVGSGAALLVTGDEVRLRQVIGNLMSNALSHTPDGTPIDVLIRSGNLDEAPPPPETPEPQADADEARAEAHEPPEEPDTEAAEESAEPHEAPAETLAPSTGVAVRRAIGPAAVLEVRDHGPGLTPEQADHVFERFYRADQARTSGGTGLGLAIVAALVAAHGGTTWVRSEPGDGATFSIALPLSPEAAQGDGDEFADEDDEPDDAAPELSAPEIDSPDTQQSHGSGPGVVRQSNSSRT